MSTIVANVVDRLHVSRSNRDVIRAVRAAMTARTRRDRALKATRKALYRQAIARHRENRILYHNVMGGRIG